MKNLYFRPRRALKFFGSLSWSEQNIWQSSSKKLEFQPGNSSQLRARYLYFHYVAAMLKLGRSKKAEKTEMRSHMTTPALTKVWGESRQIIQGQHDLEHFLSKVLTMTTGLPMDSDRGLDGPRYETNAEWKRAQMVKTAGQLNMESDNAESDNDQA